MSDDTTQGISGTIAVLETIWKEIQVHNPDVQDAILVIYLYRYMPVRGSYARRSWRLKGSDGTCDQVHIDSTILNEGAMSIIETLLHEAAHSMGEKRGIKNTSRQGRWHNRNFAKLADEIGLIAERDTRIGYTTPDIKPETKLLYADLARVLETTLSSYQDRDMAMTAGRGGGAGGARGNTSIKAVCPECGRIIRGSLKTFAAGDILCDPCGRAFVVVEA